jgi:hypothetical protein
MPRDHAAGKIWETNDERALFLLQKKLLVWLAVQRNFGGFGAAKASVASSAISTSARHPFYFGIKSKKWAID